MISAPSVIWVEKAGRPNAGFLLLCCLITRMLYRQLKVYWFVATTNIAFVFVFLIVSQISVHLTKLRYFLN
jgi:hypothetical protein